MSKINKRKVNAYIVLNVFWGTFSLVLLLFVANYTWEKEQLNNQYRLYQAINEVNQNIDVFIDDVMQTIYTLDIHGQDFKKCEKEFLPKIQYMLFNNPDIAGMVIKDKNNKMLCGTLTQNTNNHVTNDQRTLTLFKPKQVSSHEKQILILQQRLGNYQLHIYLLTEILAKKLQSPDKITNKIILYDTSNRTINTLIERDKENNTWKVNREKDKVDINELVTNKQLLAKSNLNSINDFQIIMIADPDKINNLALRHQFIAGLLIMLLILLIYYYLRHIITQHYSLNHSLQNGLKNKQFFPFYQPIVNKKEGRCVGAEVLIRWHTDDEDVIMPDYFIDEAEESGLIIPITLQLAEKAICECNDLLANNKPFHLAFNLSAIHFSDDDFLNSFISILKKYDIDFKQIILEITERDLLKYDDIALTNKIKELQVHGFLLAIDDFGTGHASISYLRHLPFDYLKIDQIFIQAIGTGAVTESLNDSIIHLAKKLNLHIVAEGVETITQVDYLLQNDVCFMQGWYFARAMPIAEFIIYTQKDLS